MDHITSCVIFEQVAPDVPTMRWGFIGSLWMEVRTVSTGEPLSALDDVQPAGKATHRQLRRRQSMIRRFACMQRLAHGSEHGLQAGCLGCRDAKRSFKPLRIQPQQMRACCGGAEKIG